MTRKTLMRAEVEEIPAAVDRLLHAGEATVREIAQQANALDPGVLVTVARGSSDHACTYLKYASEILLGLPTASVGPSVASIYGARLKLKNALCLAVSQSGKSPDIVEMTRSARDGGAFAIAVTNDTASPLAQAANATLDIQAGPELSVAATKTFVTSAVAGLWLIASMKRDDALLAAIRALPADLERAVATDWSPVTAAIGDRSIYTLGRGPGWAMSNEAALKFKETCQLHAESFSSAEVMHGPVSIVDRGFPVIAFAAADAAEQAVSEVADALAAKGANVFVTSHKAQNATVIEHVRTGHWLTDPVALIVSFYAMVEKVAEMRGINPDMPRHLNKVTETL
ncbi:SIS domain-containing protein [Tropicimonas isoalkanivorans]|uniref:Glutamine--fructose-6-phosphate transaminase n=1 Tax=Tropicimonas isoalkanivorans TaxID=441112 RepID=A0A1I1DD16_9RHOB|nr:SIS domain-containing protein [Tropicimonas isoalkanivorans]SFB72737.1 glutamine--fructose-6-phosphate transaminase [Tropicimonas isoalkanivorans]